MRTQNPLLVMAGAREAHEIVAFLRGQGRRVIATLPERERSFEALEGEVHQGRFDDETAFRRFLAQHGVVRVLDASHGFDAGLSDMAAQVCAQDALAYARVLRPLWQPDPEDDWRAARDVADAAGQVPPGARVFSNTGRATAGEYAGFAGAVLFLRRTQEGVGKPPFDFMQFICGTPPFSVAEETALLSRLRIDLLICRNVGGTASFSKIEAARHLGLPVLMIDRPPPPAGAPCFANAADALNWEATL